MKLKFLRRAQDDLNWYRRYYRIVFPAGRRNASAHFLKTLTILTENPRLGRIVSETGVRELPIPRIPFSLIYRLSTDEISIMRVIDQRSARGVEDFSED